MGPGGAAGLPLSFAKSLLVAPMKGQIPAGAFANRIAIPAPGPSFPLKNKSQK